MVLALFIQRPSAQMKPSSLTDKIWVSGEVISYPNLSASGVLAFNISGELAGGPVYISPNQDSISWVPALFSTGGEFGQCWMLIQTIRYSRLTISTTS